MMAVLGVVFPSCVFWRRLAAQLCKVDAMNYPPGHIEQTLAATYFEGAKYKRRAEQAEHLLDVAVEALREVVRDGDNEAFKVALAALKEIEDGRS